MGERFSASAMAFVVALHGCGGETNDSRSVCAGTEPCGGDVLGVWDITGACASEDVARVSQPFTEPECSGAGSGTVLDITGTYEFRADGTGSVSGELSFSFTMRLTDACVRALGGSGVDESVCSQFETSLNDAAATDPTSPLAGGTCSLSGSACSCRVLGRPQSLSSGGAYHVEGSEIVDDTNGYREGFCVEGDTLTLISETDVDGQPVSLYITMRRR